MHYSCSCPTYLQRHCCEHALLRGIQDGLVDIPDDRALQSIGRVPRAGRPSKAKGALEINPDELAAADDHWAKAGHDDASCCECAKEFSHSKNKIIFCSGCDFAFHRMCHEPPVKKVPKGEWLCRFCAG